MSFERTAAEPAEDRALTKVALRAALIAEVKGRPFAYSVMAVGLVLGPVLIRMIFPDVTLLQSIVGGLAFGVYAALSAVPQKFM